MDMHTKYLDHCRKHFTADAAKLGIKIYFNKKYSYYSQISSLSIHSGYCHHNDVWGKSEVY